MIRTPRDANAATRYECCHAIRMSRETTATRCECQRDMDAATRYWCCRAIRLPRDTNATRYECHATRLLPRDTKAATRYGCCHATRLPRDTSAKQQDCHAMRLLPRDTIVDRIATIRPRRKLPPTKVELGDGVDLGQWRRIILLYRPNAALPLADRTFLSAAARPAQPWRPTARRPTRLVARWCSRRT